MPGCARDTGSPTPNPTSSPGRELGPCPDYNPVEPQLTEIQGGTIRGSINLPAQSLYLTLPSLYAIFKKAGLRKVIFYCGVCPGYV